MYIFYPNLEKGGHLSGDACCGPCINIGEHTYIIQKPSLSRLKYLLTDPYAPFPVFCVKWCVYTLKNFLVVLTNEYGYLSCAFVFSRPGTEQILRVCKMCRISSKKCRELSNRENYSPSSMTEHGHPVWAVYPSHVNFLSHYSGNTLHIAHLPSIPRELVTYKHSVAIK